MKLEPICTRVTPESLPGLLERLEAVGVLPSYGLRHSDSSITHILHGYGPVSEVWGIWRREYDGWAECSTLTTPNEFILRVAAACPKEGGR